MSGAAPTPAPGLPGNPYPQVDVDLDELVSASRTVRFGGEVWTIPGDMPLEVYLLMQAAAAAGDIPEDATAEDSAKAQKDGLDRVMEAARKLLGWEFYDEDGRPLNAEAREELAKLDRRLKRVSFPALSRLVWSCYGSTSHDDADGEVDADAAAKEGEGDPPTTTPPGTSGTEPTS